MTPKDLFYCEKYHCKLMGRACVLMQEKAPKLRNGGTRWKGPSHCRSGKCFQGLSIKKKLVGQWIEPPRVNPTLRRRGRKAR